MDGQASQTPLLRGLRAEFWGSSGVLKMITVQNESPDPPMSTCKPFQLAAAGILLIPALCIVVTTHEYILKLIAPDTCGIGRNDKIVSKILQSSSDRQMDLHSIERVEASSLSRTQRFRTDGRRPRCTVMSRHTSPFLQGSASWS